MKVRNWIAEVEDLLPARDTAEPDSDDDDDSYLVQWEKKLLSRFDALDARLRADFYAHSSYMEANDIVAAIATVRPKTAQKVVEDADRYIHWFNHLKVELLKRVLKEDVIEYVWFKEPDPANDPDFPALNARLGIQQLAGHTYLPRIQRVNGADLNEGEAGRLCLLIEELTRIKSEYEASQAKRR